MKKVNTYAVYVNQINQCRYEVRAEDENEAVIKARKIWRSDNYPDVDTVEILHPIEKDTCSTCRHFNPDNNAGEFQCPIKHDEISEPDDDSCDKWEGR